MSTVQAGRTVDGLGRYNGTARHRAFDDPWHVVYSPLVQGVWTAYRDREQAVEHAARLYIRLGAVCTVEDRDGLPT